MVALVRNTLPVSKKRVVFLKIMKFGGQGLKDGNAFVKVANIILSEKDKRVVVLSAVAGVTNELVDFVKEIRSSQDEIKRLIQKIRSKHFEIILDAIDKKDTQGEVMGRFNEELQKLERLLYGVAYTEELTKRTMDFITSFGEIFAVMIMESVLLSMGAGAKALRADRIGLLTDGIFGSATALLPETEKNFKKSVLPYVRKGTIPVITGYFGADKEGRITTFGRNGSDYSAAVIANALNADVLEVWKDVNGFMTGDPRMIQTATRITELSYEEAAELAYFGAKILHPRTVEPVMLKEIPIVIRNVNEVRNPGTRVWTESKKQVGILKSVAIKNNVAMLRIYGAGAGYTSGIFSQIFKLLGDNGISVYSTATSQTSFTIVIEAENAKKALMVLSTITGGIVEDVTPFEKLSLICLVGVGMKDAKGLAGRVFTAVANAGVNVETISAGASRVAFNFIVKEGDKGKAARAVHDEFFENSSFKRSHKTRY